MNLSKLICFLFSIVIFNQIHFLLGSFENKNSSISDVFKILLVIKGEDAKISEFPWHVSLARKTSCFFGSYRCGGTIIGKKWILTAKHCLFNRKNCKKDPHLPVLQYPDESFYIFAGNNQNSLEFPLFTYPSKIGVKKSYFYNTEIPACSNINDDIALLELDRELVYQENKIMRANLLNDWNGEKFQTLAVCGWGLVYKDKLTEKRTNTLKKANLTDVSLRGDEKIIETKDKINSPCYGDSGSGLVTYDRYLNKSIHSYVVGIVSYAARYCDNEISSGFVRISYYREWINTTIGSN